MGGSSGCSGIWLVHVHKVPEEPIPWATGLIIYLNLFPLHNPQGRLAFHKTSILQERQSTIVISHLLAIPNQLTIVPELPEGIVPALVGRDQTSFPLVPGQASPSGDIDEVDCV